MTLPRGFIQLVNFDVGRAQDVTSALEFDPEFFLIVVENGMPLFIRKWFELLIDGIEKLIDQTRISGETDFQGVFNNQRQKLSRGLGAVYRAFKPGGHQVWQPTYVVDMHVGDDEGEDRAEVETDLMLFEAVEMVGILALEQAAVDQHGVVGSGDIAVAAAGNAIRAAMVLELWVVH